MLNLFRKTKELVAPKINPLNGVYITHSLQSFAGSLIMIYVPIYLLKLNFSLKTIFIYFLIFNIAVFTFFALAAYLAKSFGLKKVLSAGLILQLIYIFTLHQLKNYSIPIFVIAALSGLQAAFYWFPINVFFAKHSNAKKMGGSVGKLFAIPKLITLPAPILAGVVIVVFGFDALFVICALIYCLAFIPLSVVPELKEEIIFKFSNFFYLFKKYTRYFVAEFLENIREEVEYILLPIFIFLTFKDIISVGAVSTFASLGAIIFSLFVGKLADKKDKRILMRVGVVVLISVWVWRIFIPNPIIFYSLSLVTGFVEILILVPFTSIIIANAKQENLKFK